MKKLLVLTFLFSFSALAENSRAPAVIGPCDLNIPTTFSIVVDGKVIIKEKPIAQVQKELCKEAKKCMASADDSEMPELKKIEAIACNNSLPTSVTTNTPSVVVDKNFDGQRDSKPKEVEIPPTAVAQPATVAK